MNTGRLRLRRPPAWLVSNVVVVLLMAGYLWLDKSSLHLLTSPRAATQAQVQRMESDSVITTYEMLSKLDRLTQRVDVLDGNAFQLPNAPKLTPRSSQVVSNRQ